jgi:hypothetical protein
MARLLSNTKREAKVWGHGYFDDFVYVLFRNRDPKIKEKQYSHTLGL